jgi:predicted ATP-grasp superfamily ATP-dependent carboligase
MRTNDIEHIDWNIMGPIYKEEAEALRRKMEELERKVEKQTTKSKRRPQCLQKESSS